MKGHSVETRIEHRKVGDTCVFIFYCYATDRHQVRDLEQHKFLISQFHRTKQMASHKSGVWVRDDSVLCSESHKAEIKVLCKVPH